MVQYAAPDTEGSVVSSSPATTTSSAASTCRRPRAGTSRTRPPSPARPSARSPAAPPKTSRRRWTPRTVRPRLGQDVGRANAPGILIKIADRIEQNLEMIAVAEAWENGKAGPRDPGRRHPAGHRPLPLLRRRPARPGGRHLADRRGHRRLPLPRAARRRRPDHPVELPDPDGGLEARPGAGRGQRHRAQAGRADPGLDPRADRTHRRPAPAGRAQHRQRLRRRGGQAAGVEQAASARSPSPARPRPAG